MPNYIKCARCGKEIEQKGQRIYCIRCRGIVDKELAKKYRERKAKEKEE